MSKQEIEILLKKGILGLIEENAGESRAFMEEDIEDILKKNSRIAKYSLINGTYSFSKSSFCSKQTDQNINMDDPNFWEIVLKSSENHSKKLLTELDKNPNQFENYEKQKEFVFKVNEIVNQLIDSKLNLSIGYNADEETNIQEILNRILALKFFHKNYKDLASKWLYEIARPTRRFKKLNMGDLDISVSKRNYKAWNDNKLLDPNEKKEEEKGNDSEADQIFNEGDEENISQEEYLENQIEIEDENGKRKLTQKELEDKLRKLCHYCERIKCTNFCDGFCKRNFHELCLTKYEEENTKEKQDPHTLDINELKLDSDRVTKLMKSFTCKDCAANIAICFKCKKKGIYLPSESKKERKKNGIDEGIESELTKCSTVNCYRFYHLNCVINNKLLKFVDTNKTKFRCPLHYCGKCGLTGDSMTLIQCFRCPLSYHIKCCPPKDNIYKLSKKFMICQHHELPSKNEKKNEEEYGLPIKKKIQTKISKFTKPNTQTGSTVIKIPKFQDNLDNFSNSSSIQAYKIKKKIGEKIKTKETERTSKLLKNMDNSLKDSTKNIIKLKNPEKSKVLPIIKKKSGHHHHHNIKRISKPSEEFKYSYEELKIPAPEDFDYDNYQKDWCRYCGSRFSSNFTKGPWGPRTLCTIHYIDWNQKKTLNLNMHKEKPKRPVDLKYNTELSFLTKKIKINPDFDAKGELEDILRKKIKLNEDNSDKKEIDIQG